MRKTYVQLIGPIQSYPHWESNFQKMSQIIAAVFKEKEEPVEIINPASFSQLKYKEPLLIKFKEFEKEVVRLFDLPAIYEPNETNEAFWFAISMLTIPACDYVFVSKLAVHLSVGSAIETLWASRAQVNPLFEVHITPEELERALKNAAFMAEMNDEEIYVLIESQTMTLTFATQKDYEEKKKLPNVKFFEIMKIKNDQPIEELKQELKNIIQNYKKKGYWALFPSSTDTNIGFVLTFYNPNEFDKPAS